MRAARDLIANLKLGLAFSLLVPTDWRRFRVGPDQFVLLSLLYVIWCLLFGLATTDDSRSFNVYGLSHWLSVQFVFVVAILLIAWSQGARRAVPYLVIVPLSALLPVHIVLAAMELLFRLNGLGQDAPIYLVMHALVLLWSCAIDLLCFRAVLSISVFRAGALTAVFVGLVSFGQVGLPREPVWFDDSFDWNSVNIWDQEDEEPAFVPAQGWAPYRAIDSEALYYAQPDLMDRALSSLAVQRPDIADLYFIGFGSYAYEDVFLNEVRSVRKLFDGRFDTTGRSIALINNLRSIRDTPLASISNLRRALNEVGRLIDPQQDIVFLYLTSHGSQDHRLAVNFWPLDLNSLSPSLLREMLAESGIVWSVVVVSACNSGGFIAPLATEHTLVLTAARHDRTSFGCSNEREFTYFGDAYFNRELRRGLSFIDAFDSAARLVGEWERSRGYQQSLPQIHLGAAIREKLRKLEERFGAAERSASLSAPAPSGPASPIELSQ